MKILWSNKGGGRDEMHLVIWAVVIGLSLAGCVKKRDTTTSNSNPSSSEASVGKARAVTADIQAGIEKHIEEQSKLNNGYFKLNFRNKELSLKLVRVHVEYLAALGPDENFACVDLADTDGEVYDVDFFLKGPPDNMSVTQTTVHKINGQPLYAWKQNRDKTWGRVPVDEASNELLGVIEGKDVFEFVYRVELPQITDNTQMWLPIAVSDKYQTIKTTDINGPGKQTMLVDNEHGNQILLLDLAAADSGKIVELRYKVERKEKSAYADENPNKEKYLREEPLIPFNDEFRKLGAEAVAGKKGELVRARALYDHVIERMSYKKVGEGWGKGDPVYACDSRTGNCSDYHSYFIVLARMAGIPARFAIGASIPSSRNEGGIGGYHCWAEFFAEGKWWPIDISEGDKYSRLSTYYFGHHPANRIELSKGRDLRVAPGPVSGPINFLAYPVLEVDGKRKRIKPKLSFTRESVK